MDVYTLHRCGVAMIAKKPTTVNLRKHSSKAPHEPLSSASSMEAQRDEAQDPHFDGNIIIWI